MHCSDCGYKFENYDDNECRLCGSTRKSYGTSESTGYSRKSGGSGKKKYVIIPVVIVGIIFAMSMAPEQELSLPEIELPEIEFSEIELPEIELPKVELPEVEVPNILPEFNSSRIESLVFQYTNEERIKHGLSSLQNDQKLASIARHHSTDMGNRDYFQHTTPEGLDPSDRAKKVGYTCMKNYGSYYTEGVAENIAQHWLYTSYVSIGVKTSYNWHSEESLAREMVDGWMQSQGHRENILHKNYDRIGVGIAITPSDAVYATQNFC